MKKLKMKFEKLKKQKKFKSILFIFILFLLSISLIGGTIAYLIHRENFNNEFEAKGYNIEIEEEFNGEFGTKKVFIVNKNESDVVLRVSYNDIWQQELNEKILFLSNKINGTEVVTKNWTQSWLNDFTLGPDGWYYYKKILKANSRIQILDSIDFNENLAKTSNDYEYYKKYDYKLVFNYEAVYASSVAIEELWKQEGNINGEHVTWNF